MSGFKPWHGLTDVSGGHLTTGAATPACHFNSCVQASSSLSSSWTAVHALLLGVRFYTDFCDPLWVSVCAWYAEGIQMYSSAYSYLMFIQGEDYFSILRCLGTHTQKFKQIQISRFISGLNSIRLCVHSQDSILIIKLTWLLQFSKCTILQCI